MKPGHRRTLTPEQVKGLAKREGWPFRRVEVRVAEATAIPLERAA